MCRRTTIVVALISAVCVALPASPASAADPSVAAIAERVDDARDELRKARVAETEARETVSQHTKLVAATDRRADVATAAAHRAAREHRKATLEVDEARRDLGNLAATSYQHNSGMAQFAFLISATTRGDLRSRADLVTIAQRSQEHLLAAAQVDLANTANAVAVATHRKAAARAAHVAATQALTAARTQLAAATTRRAAAEDALEAAESRYASARENTTTIGAAAHVGDGGWMVSPSTAPVTSAYGMRTHPVTGVYKLHSGTDFGAPCGTGVRAAAGGTVTSTGYAGAYGNRVVIDHGRVDGSRVETTYNHLSAYEVRAGQTVTSGELVGRVGTTGSSTGCHLHFEVVDDGDFTDPMGWLR